MKQLPRTDWAWSDNAGIDKGSDCLPYRQEISAEDFPTYMARVLQVEFVRDDPNPGLAAMRQRDAQSSRQGYTSKSDLAVATVRYQINKIEIEDHLRVALTCAIYSRLGSGRIENCSAFVSREWAPKGKYSPDAFASIDHSITFNQYWYQGWNAVMFPEDPRRG